MTAVSTMLAPVLFLLVVDAAMAANTTETAVTGEATEIAEAGKLDMQEPETNHSEAIKKILKDFEETLEENKRLMMLVDEPDAQDETGKDVKKKESTPVVVTDESAAATETSEAEAAVEEAVSNSSKTRLACNNSLPDAEAGAAVTPAVSLLNGTELQLQLAGEFQPGVSNRSQPATCSIALFFASWCQFSAQAAPHYNALARVFPQVRLYAVDSSLHHSLNTQYGVMAVPSILVFHNSRPLYKYNYTEYSLAGFTQFVSLLTGLEPQSNLTEPEAEDLAGPVPSVAAPAANLFLILAACFTLLCGVWELSRSGWVRRLSAQVAAAWREAEIQHEHAE